MRAELLRELGRTDEALAWYSSIAQTATPELPFRAPAELQQARIYDQRRDETKAIDHYRRFVNLWQNCDPELRPQLIEAQARLSVLINKR